ncbi:hypothetical protein [Microseira wollei]
MDGWYLVRTKGSYRHSGKHLETSTIGG